MTSINLQFEHTTVPFWKLLYVHLFRGFLYNNAVSYHWVIYSFIVPRNAPWCSAVSRRYNADAVHSVWLRMAVQTSLPYSKVVDCVWNVMAHPQKKDFAFRRKGRVHLNRRGASVQSNTGSRGVRISGSNTGYTMFRGGVKGTGYPLHSPVSPSLPLPCVTVCHHI